MELLDCFEIRRLLALHGGHDDAVAKGQLLDVFGRFGIDGGGLESLGQEVIEHLVLNGLSVGLLVINPAGELVRILARVLLELDDGLGGLFNRDPIGVHGLDDVVIVIDTTGHLTVRAHLRSGKESEAGEGAKECFFHDRGSLNRTAEVART